MIYRNVPLIAVFIDLKKAFDSIPKELQFEVLQGLGVPPRVVEFTCIHRY